MRPSTRTLVFRQHSCFFGETPSSRWHGLFSTTQRDIWGGIHGWRINIRVYVLAMIPAGHPEMYRRGTIRIDILYRLPQPFHVLLGREIQMRGRLNWEGSRASRGQPMSSMWVPFPGDGEGLTGPVRFRRWVFETDFRYTDRPDVMVSALSLQLCDMEAWEDGSSEEENTPQTQYPLLRAARALRRRKNDKCAWWEGKCTGKYQRLSEEENEEEAPAEEPLSRRDVRAMRQFEEARTLSLTHASSSSADISSLPTNTRPSPPLPEHLRLSPSAEEADAENDSDDDDVDEDL